MDMDEEKKTNDKRDTLKVAIISSVSTLILIIIILLLVIFGMKNCSSNNKESSSSSSNVNEPTYHYDNELLNNQFIKIVNYERLVSGYEEVPTDVVVVSYIDNYPNNFNISITAKAGNTLYYYHLDNYPYSGDTSSYDNCIGYILTLDINSRLDSVSTLLKSNITTEKIVSDKGDHYVISDTDPKKYFSGFYLDNNEYKVYNYIEYTSGDNPFNSEPTLKVGITHPLYGYYQYLNN